MREVDFQTYVARLNNLAGQLRVSVALAGTVTLVESVDSQTETIIAQAAYQGEQEPRYWVAE